MKYNDLLSELNDSTYLSPDGRNLYLETPTFAEARAQVRGDYDLVDRRGSAMQFTFRPLDGRGPAGSLDVLAEYHPDSDVAIADFGAGTGRQACDLLAGVAPYQGIDLDRVRLDAFSDQKVDHLSQSSVARVAGPAGLINYEVRDRLDDFELPAFSYDIIIAYDAFAEAQRLAEPAAALDGLLKALKWGGVLYFNTTKPLQEPLQDVATSWDRSGDIRVTRYDHAGTVMWNEDWRPPTSFLLSKFYKSSR